MPNDSYPSWLAGEERRHARAPAHGTIVTLDEPAGRQSVGLRDLSEAGCRVRPDRPLRLGTCVTIDLGGQGVQGWVAWTTGGDAGIDFASPLGPATLAAIMPATVPQG